MAFVAALSLFRNGFPAITQVTGNIDCGTAPGRAAFVQIACISSGAAQPPTAVSVGGVALVKSREIIAGSNGKQGWDFAGDTIPTGVQPAVITINGAVTSLFEAIVVTRNEVQSIRSTNVPNAAGLGAAAWASTAQATVAGDLLVGMLKYETFPSVPVVAGASGTSIQYNQPTGISQNQHVVFEKTATGASTSVNLTSAPNFFPYFDTVWAVEPMVAQPPTITLPGGASGSGAFSGTISSPEETTTIGTFSANQSVNWAFTGGADAAKAAVSAAGAATWLVAPSFETPGSAASSNAYLVQLTATNAATGLSSTVNLTVNITNVNERPTFIGPTIANMLFTVGDVVDVDLSARFADVDAGDTRTPQQGGTYPAGLSVNSAFHLVGSPTAAGTFPGLTLSAGDAGGLATTPPSNPFSITVNAAGVQRTVMTGEYTRNPGNGSQPTGLINNSVAVLEDSATLAFIASGSGIAQDAQGRVALTSAALPATGTSVVVVTREADGKLGCERYTVA